jgi:NCAIR mutase (PurE)-related protein
VTEQEDVLALLRQVAAGGVAPERALERLRAAPYTDLGYAKVDYHRALRQGVGEVIYGRGKTPEQVAGILADMRANGARDVLVTRLSPEAAGYVAAQGIPMDYHAVPQLGVALPSPPGGGRPRVGNVVVASAGTSDMAVCEEAALTCEVLGNRVTRLYDVGVAGLHRLLSRLDALGGARAVVAVAGMEGALASLVGGLVACPVIAVPTSVGYGASFGGLAALLAMLNSCAAGVAVVNIDNGFGAGLIASRINRLEGPGGGASGGGGQDARGRPCWGERKEVGA